MRKVGLIVLLLVCLGIAFFIGVAGAAEEVPKITLEQLKAMLGDPSVIIIDVRLSGDSAGSDSKIRGAIQEDPGKVDSWMDKYPKDKTLVFYCA